MTPIFSDNYKKLYSTIFNLYHTEPVQTKLIFHGWHHIEFVHNKAIEFAQELDCDVEKVAVAALVHDLNYIYTDKLEPEAAINEIKKFILDAGYSEVYAENIIEIIENEHIGYRNSRVLSNESKALSDADSVFKILPETAILFVDNFLKENNYTFEKIAKQIIEQQYQMHQDDTFFYTKSAKEKYGKWAKLNFELWQNALESLKDSDVRQFLNTARELKTIN